MDAYHIINFHINISLQKDLQQKNMKQNTKKSKNLKKIKIFEDIVFVIHITNVEKLLINTLKFLYILAIYYIICYYIFKHIIRRQNFNFDIILKNNYCM